jgi:hypothetical protein
MDALNFEYPD